MKSEPIASEVKARATRRRERLRDATTVRTPRPARNDLAPHLQVISWPIEELSATGRAVRKLNPAQVERIKESIKAYGFIQPLLIRGEGIIVKGRTRMEAARQLGFTALPCIRVDHLTEAETRALSVTLSRLPELGEWDFAELQLELRDLIELDAPIEALGFTLPELDGLLLEDEPATKDEVINELDEGQTVVAELGDLWRLGEHLLVCGDALDPGVYQALLGRAQVTLVLTDEPFNVKIAGHVTSGEHREFAMASGEMSRTEFEAFNRQWMTLCLEVLAPGGLLATFIDWRSIELVLQVGRELDCELLNLVVWGKTNGGMGSLWRSQHELLPVFKKPGASHINNVQLGKGGRWRSNLWTYPGASSLGSDARDGLADHPTVKPVALLDDALLDVTNRGDLVLEPFCGSGSMLIACEKAGRRCRAIELDPRYVDVAIRRWQALTGKDAVHAGRDLTFDELSTMKALRIIEDETDEP